MPGESARGSCTETPLSPSCTFLCFSYSHSNLSQYHISTHKSASYALHVHKIETRMQRRMAIECCMVSARQRLSWRVLRSLLCQQLGIHCMSEQQCCEQFRDAHHALGAAAQSHLGRGVDPRDSPSRPCEQALTT